MKRTTSSPVRLIAQLVAGIVIGCVLCEGLLRVLVPQTTYYSSWFTPGAHQLDPELGFAFRPGFSGDMRNADKVWLEPIRLDDHGFRLPATNFGVASDADQEDVSDIIMLGGASMAFCYGLSDAETIHHQVADRIAAPVEISLVSWPGFTLAQDIQKLRRLDSINPGTLAVVFAYGVEDYAPVDQRNDPPREIRLVRSVAMPNDPAASWGGSLYYESYVVAGVCRTMDVVSQIINRLTSRFSREAVAADAAEPNSAPLENRGRRQIDFAVDQLADMGLENVVVVALPHQSQWVGPETLTVDGARVIDLRALPQSQAFDWIAFGHYGRRSAEHVAEPIAAQIAEVIGDGSVRGASE